MKTVSGITIGGDKQNSHRVSVQLNLFFFAQSLSANPLKEITPYQTVAAPVEEEHDMIVVVSVQGPQAAFPNE